MKIKLQKKILILLIMVITACLPISSYAHNGGLDALGGHHVWTGGYGYVVGTYHYHEGTYAGWIVSAKGHIPTGNDVFDASLIADSINTKEASVWAIDEINLAYESGLFKGVKNTFSSKFQTNITRAEFCKLILNYIQINNSNYKSKFLRNAKFEDTSMFKSEINTIYSLGIVNGYSEKEFRPNKPITRQEIACMLYRYLNVFTSTDINKRDIVVKDSTDIAHWADKEVHGLVSLGIIKGTQSDEYGINFTPLANTTIEQAVLLIFRMKL